ncbi:MAG: DUF1499 domain-containing protein [Hyphomicrobiaceae bacterium]
MTIARVEGATAGPRWTARIALFALVLLITAILLHRFLGLRTPVFLTLVQLVLAAAAVSLLIGLFSAVRIWRHGGQGTARILTGAAVSLGLLAWPLAYVPKMRQLPMINDVTTAPGNPPKFEELAGGRARPANGAGYTAAFAVAQAAAYPDLKTMRIERSAEETFDVVQEAVRRQKLKIVREQPPTAENDRTGVIEATDRTLIVGFYDDIAIRVGGSDSEALVDLRSASRFGRHDFGRNAERLRALMREIVARLEATVSGEARSRPAPPSARKDADRKKGPAAPRR